MLTAGSSFSLNIITKDAFGNPTEGTQFEFSCCVGEAMTKAGEYTVDVTPAIKGNPFRFDVKPGVEHAMSSSHNIATATALVSVQEITREFRAFPKDQVRRAAQS